MRRYLFNTLLFLLVACCANNAVANELNKFNKAVPVWSEDRETEKNLTLSFREVVEVGSAKKAAIRLTASCDYRLRVNGKFVAHGPCVAAHDFYRIDTYDLKPYLRRGKNVVAIEVAAPWWLEV